MSGKVFARDERLRDRLPDWEPRLFSFLSAARKMPVSYGRFDCALGLVSGAVLAQTGADLGAAHSGQYSDELQAHRYMRKNGWASLEGMMDSFLRPAPKGDRHRGNIVLLEGDLGAGFGVRVGREAIAFSEAGLSDFIIPPNTLEWSPL